MYVNLLRFQGAHLISGKQIVSTAVFLQLCINLLFASLNSFFFWQEVNLILCFICFCMFLMLTPFYLNSIRVVGFRVVRFFPPGVN